MTTMSKLIKLQTYDTGQLYSSMDYLKGFGCVNCYSGQFSFIYIAHLKQLGLQKCFTGSSKMIFI